MENGADLPTKEEVDAQQNINKPKSQFNNDDSKINIINNNKTLLSRKVNAGPAPVFIPKEKEISEINSRDINIQINPNQFNQMTNNPNQINQNYIYQNQMLQNQNINYVHQNPQVMPAYIPPPNQMNIIQPVIIQSSCNRQTNVNIRQREENIRDKACCFLIFFYISLFCRNFLFYLCCYLLKCLFDSR